MGLGGKLVKVKIKLPVVKAGKKTGRCVFRPGMDKTTGAARLFPKGCKRKEIRDFNQRARTRGTMLAREEEGVD